MISKNRIKHIKSLSQKKFREEHKQFIVEGKKLLEEGLIFKENCLLEIYTTNKNYLDNYKNIELISDSEMKQISCLNTISEVLAIFSFWDSKITNENHILALDSIQDPGNFGTILRTADWFGITTIVCSKNTVDCFNPKVVQATMGSIFRVNIFYTNLVEFIEQSNFATYGTFMNGSSFYDEKFSDKAILIMGNEGNGISNEVERLVQNRITIPKIGGGESLNVAVSTGIVLSYLK